MAISINQQTATILKFPVGGRASWSSARAQNAAANGAKRPANVCVDAWYHQEAIEDDNRETH